MGTFLSSHLDTIAIVITAIVLIWQKITSGSNGLRKEIADDYKERNTQLSGKVEQLRNELNATNVLISEFKATITEKDKHIASLTLLLQDKNPEMIKVLEKSQEIHAQVLKFMEKMDKKMDYQTSMMEAGKNRNEKIDKATKAHVGEPIRLPVNENDLSGEIIRIPVKDEDLK